MWQKLLSRKLWLAIGGFITLMASSQYLEAALVLCAYIGAQGTVDVVKRIFPK